LVGHQLRHPCAVIEPSDKLKKELDAVLYWIGDAQDKTHRLHYAGFRLSELLMKVMETGDTTSDKVKADAKAALGAWDEASRDLN